MKAKINIRFPDGSIKTINKTIRDRELIDINNKNKSHIFKDKKKYNRKDKYKKDLRNETYY